MEFSSNKPIFKQIIDMCATRVISGEWQPGQRVPSAREMSVELAVNLHTVLKAYELLERDGIIYSRRGMGFFIADGARDLVTEARRREFFDTAMPDLFAEMQRLAITPDEILDAYRHYLNYSNSHI